MDISIKSQFKHKYQKQQRNNLLKGRNSIKTKQLNNNQNFLKITEYVTKKLDWALEITLIMI